MGQKYQFSLSGWRDHLDRSPKKIRSLGFDFGHNNCLALLGEDVDLAVLSS